MWMLLRANLSSRARLAVVGGGYIGLEVAAVAVKRGLEVTVIEAADRVMGAPSSARFRVLRRGPPQARGVKFR